jgi:hypothetical protein
VIGIFHTPDQFLDESFKLIHPFDHPACTRDVLSRTLFETLVIGHSALAQKRHATLKFYTNLAKQLAVQEDKGTPILDRASKTAWPFLLSTGDLPCAKQTK